MRIVCLRFLCGRLLSVYGPRNEKQRDQNPFCVWKKPHLSFSSLPAITILIEMMTIKTTPYAAAAPRLKSLNSEAIAIDMGRFAGTKTSTEATYSPNAITNASSVPASAPGQTSGNVTRKNLCHAGAPNDPAASPSAGSTCSVLACSARTTSGMKRKKEITVRIQNVPTSTNDPNNKLGCPYASATETATTVPGNAHGMRINNESNLRLLRPRRSEERRVGK